MMREVIRTVVTLIAVMAIGQLSKYIASWF